MKIGVDLISGESDINELVHGCIDAVEEADDIEVVMIGKAEVYEPLLYQKKSFWGKPEKIDRISILEASEIITMDDDPIRVMKQKKNASILVGLQAHKRMEIDAFFSPGNTGAIVVAASLIMGRVKGIKKPALAAFLPNSEGKVNILLDVGASTDCDVDDLVKFAIMGRIFYSKMEKVNNPKVGLLNIGSESHKGTSIQKATYKALSEMNINFIGNVEGDDLFASEMDVIVCDGALGNVTLKVAEGAGKTLIKILKESITHDPMAKVALPFYGAALKKMAHQIDPEAHGGVPLLGVRGNVFIGHGKSGRGAIKAGIMAAAETVRTDVLGKIHRDMETIYHV
jgi:glycerol-3-phosphate acyltransferase PlsX